jgi:hypothetical protein
MPYKQILLTCFYCISNSIFSQCKTLSIITNDAVFISGISSKFELMVAPLSSGEKVLYKVNGSKIDSSVYRTVSSGVGIHKIFASAEIYNNNTLIETLHQTYSYLVMMPMVYWDGPNSNILYANIEQVLNVSIPGVSPNSIMLTLEGAKIISNVNGKYTIKPDSGARSVSALCAAKLPDGTVRKMGGYKLRVLEIELPTAQFNSSKPNIVAPDSLYILKDIKMLPFNLSYQITSFSITIIKNNFAQKHFLKGNFLSENLKTIIKSLVKDDVIIVDDVLCKIQWVGEKKLKPFVFTIT